MLLPGLQSLAEDENISAFVPTDTDLPAGAGMCDGVLGLGRGVADTPNPVLDILDGVCALEGGREGGFEGVNLELEALGAVERENGGGWLYWEEEWDAEEPNGDHGLDEEDIDALDKLLR